MTQSSDLAAIRELAMQLARKRFEKDISIVDDFEPDAVLIGSDADEIAEGQARIRSVFQHAIRRPHTLQLTWERVEAFAEGDIGWLYADGAAELSGTGRPRKLRYRLTAVVGRRDGVWRWRLFHGSEPKL